MLQQTQVKTVIPYYLRFMERFPSLKILADAAVDDVLYLWTGLGYYARGRNLHKTADIIQYHHQAKFPQTIDELQALPGIGRSTAGAILSLAYGQHQSILDGNVKRILCRYYQVEGWSGLAKVQKELWQYIDQLTPKQHCGDFNQALMDLGSSVCSRSKPHCLHCPLNGQCQAYLNKQTHLYPQAKPKKKKPNKTAYLLMLKNEMGEFFLEQRPQQGIWGGLWSFPQCLTMDEVTHWLNQHRYNVISQPQILAEFKHTFSHFHLFITPVIIHIKTPLAIHDNASICWFNPKKSLKIGMPAPINTLILQQTVSDSSAGKANKTTEQTA